MHSMSKRLTSLARGTGLAAAIAMVSPSASHAAPVDAVPLERPGTQIIAAPETPEPAPLPAAPATDIPAAPGANTARPAALRPAEPALLRVTFGQQDATLTPQATAEVKAFAASFKERAGRITLKAYAGAAGDDGSNARRLALKRVLAVREILLSEGIAPERLIVRALGGARDTGPLDRVDIVRPGS